MSDEDHNENGDWSAWRNHVLANIKRMDTNVATLIDSNMRIQVDIGKLKLAAAIWGSVAGAMGALVIMLIYAMIVGG
jgi:hypothetical protein